MRRPALPRSRGRSPDCGRALLEAAVIVAVALAIGTVVHVQRGKKERIRFVGTYSAPFDTGQTADTRDRGPAPERENRSDPVAAPVSPVSPEQPAARTPPEEPSGFVDPDGVIREITVEEAYEHFQSGISFIDARRTRHYEEGHIPGARSMSVWEGDFDEKLSRFMNEAELDLPYVVYCMSKKCEDSHMLAERMKQAGFTSIMVFRGGFPAWKAAGHPIETGPERPGGQEEN